MPLIAAVTARQIIDSRGRPTVEATVRLDDGTVASSSVPSGSVANDQEAFELRDNIAQEYFGLGVAKAVHNIEQIIAPRLSGMDPLYQTQIDQALVDLDGTANKSRLGGNAILAVSQANMKAAAASLRLPLFMYVKEKYRLIEQYRVPTPIFNVVNGGKHGSGTLDFQEFQVVPASHLPYSQSLRIGVELFLAVERILEQKGAIRAVGVEGGFSPNLAANTDALEVLSEATRLTNYTLAQEVFLGIDAAAGNFFKSNKYILRDRPQPLGPKELVKFYQELQHQYRIFAFEDPIVDSDWENWKFMTAEMGTTAMIVADDLVATNKTLLMKAIKESACNALVLKPNRVGTLTEAIEIFSLAQQAGWHTVLSHRSGETTDDILADLAVGIGTDYVKFGAPSRGERVVKYNRLVRIEEILLKSSLIEEVPMNTGYMAPTAAPAPSAQTNAGTAAPMPEASLPTAPAPAPMAPQPTVAPAPAAPQPAAPPAPLTVSDMVPTTPAEPVPTPTAPTEDLSALQNSLDALVGMTNAAPPEPPAPGETVSVAPQPTVAPAPSPTLAVAPPIAPAADRSIDTQPVPELHVATPTAESSLFAPNLTPAPAPVSAPGPSISTTLRPPTPPGSRT